jgi:DNA-directed RNA polymerase subunit RPC12/RpoP
MLSCGVNRRMTEEQKRNTIIAKAMAIYIPKVTMNISIALELFLKNNATIDEQIPLIISRKTRPANWVDKIGRPKCLRCDRDMMLNTSKGLWRCDLCEFTLDIKIKDCPRCNSRMAVVPVNISRCTKVDNKYNSVWMCKNKECMNTIYNKETIREILMEGK